MIRAYGQTLHELALGFLQNHSDFCVEKRLWKGKSRSKETHSAMIQAKVDGGLDQHGSSEDGEKWSDSGHAMNRTFKKISIWGVREVPSYLQDF